MIHCYCAFCRSPRRVYRKKHLGWTNVALSLILAAFLSVTIWQRLEPKALILFISGMICAEIFLQLRWRLTLPCRHCGFDPLLYLRSPKAASRKVRDHYEWRRQQPDFYLTAKSLIETQKRMQETTRQKQWEIPRVPHL